MRKVCNAIDADREAVPDDDVAQLVAARDRAIILASYGAALSSGELVSIHREDLIEVDVGLHVEVNRSENASRARRALIVRGRCPQTDPLEAVLAWLRLAGITHGPVFRAISPHGSVGTNRLTTRARSPIL